MISKKHAWLMWFIASIFYAYQYILRVMSSVMFDDIIEKFNMDISLFGQLSGIYYIGYSLAHLPLGLMLDRYGPKKILSIFMVLTVVGLVPLVCSTFWVYPIMGRLLMGIGSSAAILGVFKVIRIGFKEKHFSVLLGMAATVGLSGALYGGTPLLYLKTNLGFENSVYALIVLGLILSVITYVVIPGNVPTVKAASVMKEVKEVICNKPVLIVCALGGLMVGPLEGFADVWGARFLTVVYGIEDSIAASLPSLIFVGMCFGAPILSAIAERTRLYFTTIALSALIMCLGFLAIMTGKLEIPQLSAVFLIIGALSGYQVLVIYKASTFAKPQFFSLTTALANMIIMIFGYLFHSVIGKVVNHFSLLTGGYSTEGFIYGIAIIPVCLGIAALLFLVFALKHKQA